jgi:hypothetical protein
LATIKSNTLRRSDGDHAFAFGIFYGDLGYFMTIWYILYSFGTFCIHLVHFSGFGIMHQEKSGNPASLGLN